MTLVYFFLWCAFRLALPMSMVTSIILRQDLVTLLYLLMLFWLPMLNIPSTASNQDKSRNLLWAIFLVSGVTQVALIVFQIVSIYILPDGSLPLCSQLENWLRMFGLVRLDNVPALHITLVLVCHALPMLTALLCLRLAASRRSLRKRSRRTLLGARSEARRKWNTVLGSLPSLTLLCVVGCLLPSLPNLIYLLTFLFAVICWARMVPMLRFVAYALLFVSVVAAVQVVAIFTVELQPVQEWVKGITEDGNLAQRLLGLRWISEADCSKDPRVPTWMELPWQHRLNPVAVLALYYVATAQAAYLFTLMPTREVCSTPPARSLSGVSVIGEQTRVSKEHKRIAGRASGEVSLVATTPWYGAFVTWIQTVGRLLTPPSHITVSTLMMLWAIIFHNGVSLTMLVHALLIWLKPKMLYWLIRQPMLEVGYPTFLLLLEYALSMDLLPKEREDNFIDSDWRTAILSDSLPPGRLLVKCLFVVLFAVTMRQYREEQAREQQALEQPSAARLPREATMDETLGPLLASLTAWLAHKLTICWLWLGALVPLAVVSSNNNITIIDLVLLTLFLTFVLMFQLSYRAWRASLIFYWTAQVVISVCYLIVIYWFQFPNSRDFLAIVGLSPALQADLGLHLKSNTFTGLLPALITFIITAIQLQYFHPRFMAMTRPRESQQVDEESPRRDRFEKPKMPTFRNVKYLSAKEFNLLAAYFQVHLRNGLEVLWLALDLHVLKLMLVLVLFVCLPIGNVLHLILFVVACAGLLLKRRAHLITCTALSLFTTVVFVCVTAFQLTIVSPSRAPPPSECVMDLLTVEGLSWIGLRKTTKQETTYGLVNSYFIVVFVATLAAGVRYRRRERSANKRVMFPGVGRTMADKSIVSCLKFLANYGFYKFGVELTLIAVVILIVGRMDMVALLYAGWLCLLTSVRRPWLMRIWPAFRLFAALATILQYVAALGPPPGVCFDYQTSTVKMMQRWMFLPADARNKELSPPSNVLFWDAIVLLLACRQVGVFRIERRERLTGKVSEGGTNKEVAHLADKIGFVNTVRNHRTMKNRLDALKRFVLPAFLWTTMTVVLVTGIINLNVFASGYLIGAFFIFWMGHDLHLMPVPTVLKWWKMLLGYNVAVLFLKCWLQIPGCFFYEKIRMYACWVFQMVENVCHRNSDIQELMRKNDRCPTRGYQDLTLDWAAACFCLLLIQRRLFGSFYYMHERTEAKATSILQSRGAELIEEQRFNQIAEQKAEEDAVMESIRVKAERVSDILKTGYAPKLADPETHYTAIRAGDYYMFRAVEEEPTEKKMKQESQEVTLGQLLGTTYQTDFEKGAAFGLRSGGKSTDSQKKSRVEKRLTSVALVKDTTTTSSADLGTSHPQTQHPSDEAKLGFQGHLWTAIQFLWALIESTMNSLTKLLNKTSLNYRLVTKVLAMEKEKLTESTKLQSMTPTSSGWRKPTRWNPVTDEDLQLHISGVGKSRRMTRNNSTFVEQTSSSAAIGLHRTFQSSMEEIESFGSSRHSPAVALLLAIWYAILANSDILCYAQIFIIQTVRPTLLFLPVPLLVLLWGTLSIPRPKLTFWFTLIAYAEVCVMVKILCLSTLMNSVLQHSSSKSTDYITPVNIIGIAYGEDVLYDLFFLLTLFFHRAVLKSRGLWTSAESTGKRQAPLGKADIPQSVLTTFHEEDENKAEDDEISSESKVRARSRTHGDGSKEVLVRAEREDMEDHLPGVVWLVVQRYFQSTRDFFTEVLEPYAVVRADIYPYIFFCDFVNLLVVLFCFSEFARYESGGTLVTYFQENKVPVLFVVMLFAQFLLILIDRTLYLRKYILGKVVLQLLLTVAIHISMFYVLPFVTGRDFSRMTAPQIWYLIRCVSLLLSAYQIRCGYPTRIQGHFLCKTPGYVSLISFLIYRVLPFIYEIRALMDWMWTDTSFSLYNWMCMEDCFARIYVLKCYRYIESNYPTPRGERQRNVDKFLNGGILLIAIIAVIWFPLAVFSLGEIGPHNLPTSAQVTLRVSDYEELFVTTVHNDDISHMLEEEFEELYELSPPVVEMYGYQDAAVMSLRTDSSRPWSISLPEKQRLLDDLAGSKAMNFEATWEITRNSRDPLSVVKTVTGSHITKLPAGSPVRAALWEHISSPVPLKTPIYIDWVLPSVVVVRNSGRTFDLPRLQSLEQDRFLSLSLASNEQCPSASCFPVWWRLQDACKMKLDPQPTRPCPGITIVTLNEKMPPIDVSSLKTLSKSTAGILGLYFGLVYILHYLIRLMFADLTRLLMLTEMPNVDRIHQLLLDIYLVRENGDFRLEEDLFAKLVFLFRSPETLILYTRPRELEE